MTSDVVEEEIFIGRDNIIEVTLLEDGTAVNLASVISITVTFGGYSVSSSDGSVFPLKWGGALATGILQMQLGATENLRSDTQFIATITLVDPDNLNGLLWIDEDSDTKLRLSVR